VAEVKSHALAIPDELKGIIRAIHIHPNGSIAVHYAESVAVGGVMADGMTFLAGPSHVGPYEIRVERTLVIEVNRKAKRLGQLIETEDEPRFNTYEMAKALVEATQAARRRGLDAAPGVAIAVPRTLPGAGAQRALPPVQGYRDPRPGDMSRPVRGDPRFDMPPELVDALTTPVDEEDPLVVRGRLLEPYDAAPSSPAVLCDSCGEPDGSHARGCRRCPECGCPDRDACEC
jgi:hypothetical protein